MRWIVYYHDGSTFSSEMGEPKDAPAYGAQIILSLSDNGWIPLQEVDFYYFRRYEDGFGEWFRAPDVTSLVAQVLDNTYIIERVLQGLTMRQKNWEALERRARKQLKALRKA